MMDFALTHQRQQRTTRPCVVLVSSDGDYAYSLARLRHAGVITVLICVPGTATSALQHSAEINLSWRDDVLDIVPYAPAIRGPPAPEKQSRPAATPLPQQQQQQALPPPLPPLLPITSMQGAGKDLAWAQLEAEERSAAQVLGYDQVSWDNFVPPSTASKPWARLSTDEQRAAGILGYDATSWSEENTQAESTQHKTVLCKFFFQGQCKNGSTCTFAHGEAELRRPGDVLGTLQPLRQRSQPAENDYADAVPTEEEWTLCITQLCAWMKEKSPHGVPRIACAELGGFYQLPGMSAFRARKRPHWMQNFTRDGRIELIPDDHAPGKGWLQLATTMASPPSTPAYSSASVHFAEAALSPLTAAALAARDMDHDSQMLRPTRGATTGSSGSVEGNLFVLLGCLLEEQQQAFMKKRMGTGPTMKETYVPATTLGSKYHQRKGYTDSDRFKMLREGALEFDYVEVKSVRQGQTMVSYYRLSESGRQELAMALGEEAEGDDEHPMPVPSHSQFLFA